MPRKKGPAAAAAVANCKAVGSSGGLGETYGLRLARLCLPLACLLWAPACFFADCKSTGNNSPDPAPAFFRLSIWLRRLGPVKAFAFESVLRPEVCAPSAAETWGA